MSLSDVLNQAVHRHQSGQLQAAEKGYRQILAQQPDHADANHLLGLLAYQGGFFQQAVDLISLAIDKDASQAIYHNSLGLALRDLDRTDDAVSSFQRAIVIAPTYTEALNNLAQIHVNRGDDRAAIGCLEQSLAASPQQVDAWGTLGNALMKERRYEEASSCLRKLLALNPEHVGSHCNLGVALQQRGLYDDAISAYKQALLCDPNHIPAHINWGLALQDLHQLDSALERFRCALAIDPKSVDGLSNLGVILQQLNRLEEAKTCLAQALEEQPDHAKSQANMGAVQLQQGYPQTAADHFSRALELQPDFPTALSNLLLTRLYLEQTDRAENLALARQINGMFLPTARRHHGLSTADRSLRIGFVSGDLRRHAVSCFLESVWTHLNGERLQIYAYATSPTEDEVSERLKSRSHTWRNLAGFSLEDRCTRIADDQIDILVDLAGHTANNNLALFAQKPAPIQVSWLGYSATTGLDAMDYILADPHVLPAGEENQFSETPWRLPESFLCFTPPEWELAICDSPTLAAGHLTFGCFNNLSKLTDQTIACWTGVLRAVPDSRLLLKAKQLGNSAYRSALLRRFERAGLETGRVKLIDRTPGLDAHLTAYNQVDIALDPYPYTGTTTTVEALWMGVPVLTLKGDRFVAHVGESLLSNVGLESWIASSEADLVIKATAFARDPLALNALRHGLRRQLLDSPLCDARGFSEHLEAAFRRMWTIYCQDQSAPAPRADD